MTLCPGFADLRTKLATLYRDTNQPDKARAAVVDARRALAGDAGKLRRLDDLLKGLGLEG